MTIPIYHNTTVQSFTHLTLVERGMIFALQKEYRSIRYTPNNAARTGLRTVPSFRKPDKLSMTSIEEKVAAHTNYFGRGRVRETQ